MLTPEDHDSNLDQIEGAISRLADGKVDKTPGKGLSQNDYSDADRKKLSEVEEKANRYTHPDKHTIDEVDGLRDALDGKESKRSPDYRLPLSKIENGDRIPLPDDRGNLPPYPNVVYRKEVVEVKQSMMLVKDHANVIVRVRGSSDMVMLTLPASADYIGHEIVIINDSPHHVRVCPIDGELLNGQLYFSMVGRYSMMRVFSDGRGHYANYYGDIYAEAYFKS